MLHPSFDIEEYLLAPVPKRGGRPRTPKPYQEPKQSQRFGSDGEESVAKVLEQRGFKVHRMPHRKSPFDLLLDGRLRVEVKVGQPSWVGEVPEWSFNIHRHGVLTEGEVDLYILRLEDVPYFKHALHLLFEAPLSRKTITVSLRSLLGKHAGRAVAFSEFCKARQTNAYDY